jgi:hypothetical protein
VSNHSEPLNTAPIQQFIQQVRSADAGKVKEVKLDLQNAKRLAFCLGEVMTRLEGNLEEILVQKGSSSDEVIEVKMDGGSSW